MTKRLGSGLSTRDLDVLRHVAAVGRASSNQLYELSFTTTKRTWYTVRDRLVAHQYLRQSERQFAGDVNGGNAQYIYALGREGWELFFPERKFPGGAVLTKETLHTMAVADVYVDIFRRQRAGLIEVRELLTEPECHRDYGSFRLEPDMEVNIVTPRAHFKMFLEVDRGTENKTDIVAKLKGYQRALRITWEQDQASGSPSSFPGLVVFVVLDRLPGRVKQLNEWISQQPEDFRKLFRVMTCTEFSQRLA